MRVKNNFPKPGNLFLKKSIYLFQLLRQGNLEGFSPWHKYLKQKQYYQKKIEEQFLVERGGMEMQTKNNKNLPTQKILQNYKMDYLYAPIFRELQNW